MKNRYSECNCMPAQHPCGELGNGINILTKIKSLKDVEMKDILFCLHFYTYTENRKTTIRKDQLKYSGGEYYALLNEKCFAEGWLMCEVEILELANGWPNGLKPVTIECSTGHFIGSCSDGYPFPEECRYHCGVGYENGYNITFTLVDEVPDSGEVNKNTLAALNEHVSNKYIHVSKEDREKWDQGVGGETFIADEEDITLAEKTEEVQNEDGDVVEKTTQVYKFKDRGTEKGKGYIILRTEKPLSEQVFQENTIYEVRYDFDLGGGTIEIPVDSVLDFRGGSFFNGVLMGNNTLIKGYDNAVFGENLVIEGTYINESAKTGWFKIAEGCIDACQVISRHVEISDSRNYGTANLQDGCVLDVNGQDAVFDLINTYGEYVYIDLAGGSIGSTFGGGLVAETVTGGNTFIAQEGHSFYVGQKLHSSKNVGANTYQFFGNANFPKEDPVLITGVNGNTITINKNLEDYTLHKGLGLGNTEWNKFIEAYGNRLTIANGTIKNIYSYVCSTESEGVVQFDNVEFKNLGLDSFALKHYATLKFNSCIIDKPIDYAKSSIMIYQGNLEVNDCKCNGGNFDYFIGCWSGDYEGDDTIERGYIKLINSEFNGEKIDTDPSVQNSLHAIGWEKNGTLDEFIVKGCTFKGYARHIISSSSLPVDYNITFRNVNIENIILYGAFWHFRTTSLICEKLNISGCSFYNSTKYIFCYVIPYNFNFYFNNCNFDNVKGVNQIFSDNRCFFNNCTFTNCLLYRNIQRYEFISCIFNNTPICYGPTQTSTRINFYDRYQDCKFMNCEKPQIWVYRNWSYTITVVNCWFINCNTVFQSDAGTSIGSIKFYDNYLSGAIDGVFKVNGWSDGLYALNIYNCDDLSLGDIPYHVAAEGKYKFINCTGIENSSYPKEEEEEIANLVSGVKGDAESEYRQGNVNITPTDIGLGNVSNTADSEKTVKHSSTSDIAGKATNDGEGNNIAQTYAKKESINEISKLAQTAESKSSEALAKSESAIQNAATAKNAVATLEGLANTTTAQETLAAQVVQIEENKTDINALNKSLSNVFKSTNEGGLEYPDNSLTKGYYLSNNNLVASEGWVVTDYIEFPDDSVYYFYIQNVVLGGGFISFYDVNKNYSLGYSGSSSEVSEKLDAGYYKLQRRGSANVKYVRISCKIYDVNNPILYSFGSELKVRILNEFKDEVITVEKLEKTLQNKLTDVYPVLMTNWIHNQYYDKEGSIKSDANNYYSCAIYDVSRISYLNDVYITLGGGLPSDLCPIVMFDAVGNVINYIEGSSSININSIDVSSANMIAVSFRNNTIPNIFTDKPNSVMSVNTNLVLTSGTKYITPITYIKKNVVVNVCFKVLSSFSYITLGRGQSEYFKYTVKINKTSVTYNSVTKDLGFELVSGDLVSFEVKADEYNNNTITISRGEDVFTISEVFLYGDGSTFLQSDGIEVFSSNSCCLDATRSVFYYGDSYAGTSTPSRWPYVASEIGCSFLVNGLSGGKSKDMLGQVALDISRIGIPKIVLWGLGMNDGADANSTPNSNWSIYIPALKSYCERLGILFIPCTIPSVPNINHSAKNSYIKNNFSRYVDFAAAVDNGIDATWVDGALHTDNVHPTAFGARLLAVKAIADCPELVS